MDEGPDYKQKKSGYFITVPKAVGILVVGLLILTAAVLITYFAHPDYDKKCIDPFDCPVPDIDDIDEDIIWEECTNISIARDECKFLYHLYLGQQMCLQLNL